ncbi:hypothetical protein KR059_001603 [Drosophila kikkawai]|nr:hypothetical protein KR059_001603 [Drosophila kikkawai]
MDYEKLALNASVGSAVGGGGGSGSGAEQDSSMCGGQEMVDGRAKEKARRYWTPSEEERLYEIWGRDNWRLTRTGKNTIFFGKWAEELRERYGVDVKPEEIQMKVNQTRAKFRQVKKNLQADPTSYATRWKKYDIINRILKNLHRPKNAEPLPPEALLNNRDMTPPREDGSMDQLPSQQQPLQQQAVQQQGIVLAAEPPAATFYNSSSNSNHGSSHNNNNSGGMSFSTELFTDQYDEVVKQEYEDDEYRSLPFQEQLQQYSPAEPAQLLELQTPQQQQQHQQQQQQQQYQPGYEQHQFQQQPAHFANNNSGTISAVATSSINHQPITAVAYINSSNNTISVATNSNGGMPAPVPAAVVPAQAPSPAPAPVSNPIPNSSVVGVSPVPVPRKRGRPHGSVNLPAADSLEALYMEEVRRKNKLLYEQTEISRQRLELERRKVDLLQSFFPKCLEQQTQILSRIMQLSQQQPHQPASHQQLPAAGRPQ